jgi:hypothetical protein
MRVQDTYDVLHFEIGVERMGEDRVKNFALMVIHRRILPTGHLAYDKIWVIDRCLTGGESPPGRGSSLPSSRRPRSEAAFGGCA